MKIVLINPPQLFSKTQVAAGVVPPLGLLYLAAFLKQHSHQPILIESVIEGVNNIYGINSDLLCRGLSFNEIISRIPPSTGLIGISNLFSFAFPIVRLLANELKKAYPKVPIVLGGAHVSATPLETLASEAIDFVVIGEGEVTLLELADKINDYQAWEKIDGLAYKDKFRTPFLNPRTKFIENIDSLPFPARELVPLNKYYNVSEAHGPSQDRWTPILSSRGCPFECTFCTSRLWDRRYRARSAQNILAEIEECLVKYGIKEFHFEDENFTLNKKRILEICQGIKKRKLAIKWQTPNGIRASVTDFETLVAMKESGCYHITVAPESGSKRVLEQIIRKHQDLSQVTAVIEEASKIGLKTAAYFIIGLPGETITEVKMSIKYACKLARLGLDEVVFSGYIPLPGSELYENLKKEGTIISDWGSLISIGDLNKTLSEIKIKNGLF